MRRGYDTREENKAHWELVRGHLLDYLDLIRKGVLKTPKNRIGSFRGKLDKQGIPYHFTAYLEDKGCPYVPSIMSLSVALSKGGRLFDIVLAHTDLLPFQKNFQILTKEFIKELLEQFEWDIKNDKIKLLGGKSISYYNLSQWMLPHLKKKYPHFEYTNFVTIRNMCANLRASSTRDLRLFSDRVVKDGKFTDEILSICSHSRRAVRRIYHG